MFKQFKNGHFRKFQKTHFAKNDNKAQFQTEKKRILQKEGIFQKKKEEKQATELVVPRQRQMRGELRQFPQTAIAAGIRQLQRPTVRRTAVPAPG